MLLTKESDYGARIIRALFDGTRKTVEDISTAEHIPHQYAYKILKKLQQAKLVVSIKGREGGYLLTKSANEITLYDIVTAIDKNAFINECLRESNNCPLKKLNTKDVCAMHVEFIRLQGILENEMKKRTMQEILINQNQKEC